MRHFTQSHAFCIDLAISKPQTYYAVLSKKRLRAQLADGKMLTLQTLVRLFALYDNLPLEIKIMKDVKRERKTVEACLSEMQLSLFYSWVRSRIDRLIILGAYFSDVKRALRLSRCSRDVIEVDSLGVLEHVVVCKLGTDAVGLIPKLGRVLKSSALYPFSPKKILENIDSEFFDL